MERRRPKEERQPSKETGPYKRIVLEVGCGQEAYLHHVPDEYLKDLQSDPEFQYIGIDFDAKDLKRSDDKRARYDGYSDSQLPTKRMLFVRARGSTLPLANNSVSEEVFRNVFGDPDIHALTKLDLLEEAERVLKAGGILRIIEQYTPSVAKKQYLRDAIATLQRKGYERVESGSLSQSDMLSDEEMMDDFGFDREPFVLRLRKPTA